MPPFIPLAFERLSPADSLARAEALYASLSRRRSVRQFSPEPLPPGLVETLIRAAGTAPSGANQQPWRFIVVTDADLKRRLRAAAEAEEREFYTHRATAAWLADLEPLGTDWRKPFLEDAPVLVVVFRIDYERVGGRLRKHYYVNESVGIAVGLFLAAAHTAGLATLTHTPSPMGFLNGLLSRPTNERPFVVIPLGYPAADAVVPDIQRKPLDAIIQYNTDAHEPA